MYTVPDMLQDLNEYSFYSETCPRLCNDKDRFLIWADESPYGLDHSTEFHRHRLNIVNKKGNEKENTNRLKCNKIYKRIKMYPKET